MNAVRVLGGAGLAAAVMTAAAGLLSSPRLLFVSGAVMAAANVFALLSPRRAK